MDTALAASHAARLLIGEVNEQMPRTLGNTLVPLSKLHARIHTNRPLQAHAPAEPNASRMPSANRSPPSCPMAQHCFHPCDRTDSIGFHIYSGIGGQMDFSIAHPDFRAELRRAFAETRHYVLPR